jgi:hypothetical protein
MRAIIAFLALGSISASALNGQIYGEWDVPCAVALSPRFSAPFSHGVIYQGKEFVTPWRSVNQTTPLPSYNWYEPVGNANPISTDGTSRWYGAKLEGHCTVDRNPYWVRYNVYPVAYEGQVRSCSTGAGGNWYYITDPIDESYDPYTSAGSGSDCESDGGSDSVGTCHDEYVYVEVSNDGGLTWEVLWEGWAQVCG